MGAPKRGWTPEEERALRAGVDKYGPGKWRAIQKDPELGPFLLQRSNVDLKDKWRNMTVASGQLVIFSSVRLWRNSTAAAASSNAAGDGRAAAASPSPFHQSRHSGHGRSGGGAAAAATSAFPAAATAAAAASSCEKSGSGAQNLAMVLLSESETQQQSLLHRQQRQCQQQLRDPHCGWEQQGHPQRRQQQQQQQEAHEQQQQPHRHQQEHPGGCAHADSFFDDLILGANTSFNDHHGVSAAAIAQFIEERHAVPANFRRMCASRLKALSDQGKLLKRKQVQSQVYCHPSEATVASTSSAAPSTTPTASAAAHATTTAAAGVRAAMKQFPTSSVDAEEEQHSGSRWLASTTATTCDDEHESTAPVAAPVGRGGSGLRQWCRGPGDVSVAAAAAAAPASAASASDAACSSRGGFGCSSGEGRGSLATSQGASGMASCEPAKEDCSGGVRSLSSSPASISSPPPSGFSLYASAAAAAAATGRGVVTALFGDRGGSSCGGEAMGLTSATCSGAAPASTAAAAAAAAAAPGPASSAAFPAGADAGAAGGGAAGRDASTTPPPPPRKRRSSMGMGGAAGGTGGGSGSGVGRGGAGGAATAAVTAAAGGSGGVNGRSSGSSGGMAHGQGKQDGDSSSAAGAHGQVSGLNRSSTPLLLPSPALAAPAASGTLTGHKRAVDTPSSLSAVLDTAAAAQGGPAGAAGGAGKENGGRAWTSSQATGGAVSTASLSPSAHLQSMPMAVPLSASEGPPLTPLKTSATATAAKPSTGASLSSRAKGGLDTNRLAAIVSSSCSSSSSFRQCRSPQRRGVGEASTGPPPPDCPPLVQGATGDEVRSARGRDIGGGNAACAWEGCGADTDGPDMVVPAPVPRRRTRSAKPAVRRRSGGSAPWLPLPDRSGGSGGGGGSGSGGIRGGGADGAKGSRTAAAGDDVGASDNEGERVGRKEYAENMGRSLGGGVKVEVGAGVENCADKSTMRDGTRGSSGSGINAGGGSGGSQVLSDITDRAGWNSRVLGKRVRSLESLNSVVARHTNISIVLPLNEQQDKHQQQQRQQNQRFGWGIDGGGSSSMSNDHPCKGSGRASLKRMPVLSQSSPAGTNSSSCSNQEASLGVCKHEAGGSSDERGAGASGKQASLWPCGGGGGGHGSRLEAGGLGPRGMILGDRGASDDNENVRQGAPGSAQFLKPPKKRWRSALQMMGVDAQADRV